MKLFWISRVKGGLRFGDEDGVVCYSTSPCCSGNREKYETKVIVFFNEKLAKSRNLELENLESKSVSDPNLAQMLFSAAHLKARSRQAAAPQRAAGGRPAEEEPRRRRLPRAEG